MYKKMIIKVAAFVTAVVALNESLSLFGYGMVVPMWGMYVALVSSIIVLLAFAVGILMHGGHGCYMCCHESGEHKNSAQNCHCK